MSNKIVNELEELVEHKIISPEIAQNIQQYFQSKENETPSKILIVFGVLGALLGGLGIILVFAHNWDHFSIVTKSCLALLPLAIGQIVSGFTFLKKPDSKAWTEASSVFLFFAVGASMALISQIYNIPGNFAQYILSWMLLCLPIVYLLKSSVVSLLYLIGITTYCVDKNANFFSTTTHDYWYGLLLLGIVPHYYQLITQKKDSNFTAFHHWFFPLSISIALFSLTANNADVISITTFLALFTSYYLIGKLPYFKSVNMLSNGYVLIGKIMGLYILFLSSFRAVWSDMLQDKINNFSLFMALASLLFILISYLLFKQFKAHKKPFNNAYKYALYVFLIAFAFGYVHVIIPVVLINAYVLFLGIQEITKGNVLNDIKRMNFGILIIAILIICRFFDTEMSFVIRGLLFIVIGFGFFFLNYLMIKNRKKVEKNQLEKN